MKIKKVKKAPGTNLQRNYTLGGKWDILTEDENRKIIYEWHSKRKEKFKGLRKSYKNFLIYTFQLNTLCSFIKNFNFMVIIQMVLAGVAVFLFKSFDISFDIHVGLFVSPIVFPLAFSINTDFQRREKVLDDLANFKSAAMILFFCMRDWKKTAELDDEWLKTVHSKLKSMLFHLREYLLTDRAARRKVILCAMYEDISDTNQLIERVRASKLPANTALMSRAIHLLNVMCLTFERLRNVREYRSPRSIRSFNKVLIFFLPFLLAPYFVYLGKRVKNSWSPYFISVVVSFVFSALQGVQDKLDDPFDGMGEDDIKLKSIDEWTFNSLGVTANRSFNIGRFQVSAKVANRDEIRRGTITSVLASMDQTDSLPYAPKNSEYLEKVKSFRRQSSKMSRNKSINFKKSFKKRGKSFLNRPSLRRKSNFTDETDTDICEPSIPLECHPHVELLEKLNGNDTIRRHRFNSSNSEQHMIEGIFLNENNGGYNISCPAIQESETKIDIENAMPLSDEHLKHQRQVFFQDDVKVVSPNQNFLHPCLSENDSNTDKDDNIVTTSPLTTSLIIKNNISKTSKFELTTVPEESFNVTIDNDVFYVDKENENIEQPDVTHSFHKASRKIRRNSEPKLNENKNNSVIRQLSLQNKYFEDGVTFRKDEIVIKVEPNN